MNQPTEQCNTYRVEHHYNDRDRVYYYIRCPDGRLMCSTVVPRALSSWSTKEAAQAVADEANAYLVMTEGE